MEKICINCKYFVQVSAVFSSHVWGDCIKHAENTPDMEVAKKNAVFVWADKTCDDFEPVKRPVDQAKQDCP